VLEIEGVVEIEAGEDREDEGLQEGDEEFEAIRATMKTSGAQPPTMPRPITKPPKIFSMVWPASMLANSRTERLIGRVR